MKNLSVTSKTVAPSSVIESEIDVDVKPMMNVLIILIPFLVSLAVYTRLAVIDMSLPPDVSGISAGQTEKPKVKLTVVISKQSLCITSGENLLDSIPVAAGADYPYDILNTKLASRRQSADVKDEVVVAPHDGIHFKYVVKVMDACKKTGFEKVSLASAAENP